MLQSEDLSLLQETLTFMDHLSDSEKELLLSCVQTFTYQKGQIIHNGDADCVGVLIVKTGSIRTYMMSNDGREVNLYHLEDKDVCILSATCILESITFDVTMMAEEECTVLCIKAPIYEKLLNDNIYVEAFTYKLSAEIFSDVMWTINQVLFKSLDKRLAAFLVNETAKHATDTISMTHEQIAKQLGTAREVISRMLKHLAKDGYLSLSRGSITLLDRKGLLAMQDA